MAIKRQRKKADNTAKSRRKKVSSAKDSASSNSKKRLKILTESVMPAEQKKNRSKSLLSKLKEHLD